MAAGACFGRNAPRLVYWDDSVQVCPDLPGGRVDGVWVSSCYIYKVPRVQFSLPVVSCNVFLPEDLF